MSSMCCSKKLESSCVLHRHQCMRHRTETVYKHEMLTHRAIVIKEENKLPEQQVFRGGSYQTAHENACHTARHHTQPSLSWNKRNGRAIDADAAIDAAAVIDELLFNQGQQVRNIKGSVSIRWRHQQYVSLNERATSRGMGGCEFESRHIAMMFS